MYLEKIVREQDKKQRAAERELFKLEKEQARWSEEWKKEQAIRSRLFDKRYEEAIERIKKEGIPSDPKGHLRAILKETHKVNAAYMHGVYPVDEMTRFLAAILVVGFSLTTIYALMPFFTSIGTGAVKAILLVGVLVLAVLTYLFSPSIIGYFGIRRKIRIAAECKAGYDLIEENEPLDD